MATNPIKRQGANFVDADTGARFEIIGIDYQPGANAGFNPGADPLSDSETCLRDAIVMQQLGVNTIRVYNLDPTVSHDECASIFNAAGIYMLLDVNTPTFALNSEAPYTTYTGAYLTHIFQVVEACMILSSVPWSKANNCSLWISQSARFRSWKREYQ